MKTTGIIRRIDELGRITIPREIRKRFNISKDDALEIFLDGSNTVLRKVEPNCIFCGTTKELKRYEGKLICKNCIKKIISGEE